MGDVANIITIGASVIGGLLVTLSLIIGWMGARVIVKLDDMDDKLDRNNNELHSRINKLDIRVVRLETISGTA